MNRYRSFACGCIMLAASQWGCSSGGSSSGSPTGPSAQVENPVVTVNVEYYSQGGVRDPDWYSLRICSPGRVNCRGANTRDPAQRTPGFITWTGAMAPGQYILSIELRNPEEYISADFESAYYPPGNTGGVVRGSIRYKESASPSTERHSYSSCGVVTTLSRRYDSNFGMHYIVYDFTVGLKSTASTC